MRKWNKTGKVKSALVLILGLLPLIIFGYDENMELKDSFSFEFSILVFIFTILFLVLVTKFLSLLGIIMKKPDWNENPISLNFTKAMNFLQFIGYWLIVSAVIKILFVGLFFQLLDEESAHLFIAGISVLVGIKWSSSKQLLNTK